MNTMSRMLAEYSTMFKATAEAAPTPEAAAETAAFDEPVAADAPTADAAQQPVGVAEDTDRALAELEGMLDDIDESNPDSQPGAAAPATEKATG
jgi:hypothetical protein